MKKLLSTLALGIITISLQAQIYSSTAAKIHFFSEATLENIEADNDKARSLINTKNNNIVVMVSIVGFHFEKPLMEEHFNENYMESEQYPTAKFNGTLKETIDFSKDGSHDVSATGTLSMHGVDKEYTLNGKMVVKGGNAVLDGKFNVKLEDHKIKIPKAVFENIAEDIDITFHMEYAPKK